MSDLDELKALVAELRAEHMAHKEKEKRDRWIKYVSLTMVVIAVLSAIATLKGGGFSTATLKQMNEATYNQAQASDQWSQYQAESIKQKLYDIEKDQLAAAQGSNSVAVLGVKARVDKYEKEKADISAKAKDFEGKRDTARGNALSAAERSKAMGYSLTTFQMSIAMGAMCLIVKKKPLWFVAMTLGSIAAGWMVYVLYFMP
jgi:hypothetical protein